MSATSSSKRLSPRLAIVLIGVAIAAWAVIAFLQMHTSPAQRHIEAGNALAGRGEGLSALGEWRAAVQLEPDNLFAWQLLAQSYSSEQMWKQAADAWLQVRHLRSDVPHVDAQLATCYHRMGDFDRALDYAREALKRDSNDVPALQVDVAIQTKRGDVKEALRGLRRLTVLEPNRAEYFIALAQVLVSQNDLIAVLPVMDRILQLAPNDADVITLRGIVLFHADGTSVGMQRAEEDFRRALSLSPKLYDCDLYLGRIYRRRGRMDQAAPYLEQAARLNPKRAEAFYDLATVYARMRKPAKAIAARRRFQEIALAAERFLHLKRRADVAPDEFALQIEVCETAIQREDRTAAHHYLARAARLLPNNSQVHAARRSLSELDSRAVTTSAKISAAASLSATIEGSDIH